MLPKEASRVEDEAIQQLRALLLKHVAASLPILVDESGKDACALLCT